MKTALVSLGLLTLTGLAAVACSFEPDVDAVDDLCEQMALGHFEYRPVGYDPAAYPWEDDGKTAVNPFPLRPMGSFEGLEERLLYIPTDTLIIDDDDLFDDYPNWVEAAEIAKAFIAEYPEEVAIYAQIEPGTAEEDLTSEQEAARQVVEEVILLDDRLNELCLRIQEPLIAPRFGDDLADGYWPTFTACKDRYNASGDGVVGIVDLEREEAQEQDVQLATCTTVEGLDNSHVLNVWGPLSTQDATIPGLPDNLRDGFNFSGITVPLKVADYQQTADRSEWDGIAFWARVASAEEALPIGNTPADVEPYSGREVPVDAGPQDGVGSIGIIIQTIDTTAVLDSRDGVDGMQTILPCADGQTPEDTFCLPQDEYDDFPGQLVDDEDPDAGKYAFQDESGQIDDADVPNQPGAPQTPETPFCIDYSPVDTPVGEEVPFRDQCWDGFRSMVEIGQNWRFFRLPFSEMRQAGWGRAAKEFRTDQVRSINLLGSAFQPMNIMIDEIAFYRRKGGGGAGSGSN